MKFIIVDQSKYFFIYPNLGCGWKRKGKDLQLGKNSPQAILKLKSEILLLLIIIIRYTKKLASGRNCTYLNNLPTLVSSQKWERAGNPTIRSGKWLHTWKAKSISSVVNVTSSSREKTASVLINSSGLQNKLGSVCYCLFPFPHLSAAFQWLIDSIKWILTGSVRQYFASVAGQRNGVGCRASTSAIVRGEVWASRLPIPPQSNEGIINIE